MPVSPRNNPLIQTAKSSRPVLTVEDYCKWYDVYIIYPDGSVAVCDPDHEFNFAGTYWCDHVINPMAFIELAKANCYAIDYEAMNEVTHRWITDYYDYDYY